MKLLQYCLRNSHVIHVGISTPLGILDAVASSNLYAVAKDKEGPAVPGSLLEILEAGEVVLDRLREVENWALRAPEAKTVLFHKQKVTKLQPITRPPKIICVGVNYRDHCEEQGHPVPTSPVLFAKYPTATLAPDAPVRIPPVTSKVDAEAELGVVIGKGGRHISEKDALRHVAGYLNFNDISARDLQKQDGQWVRAKSLDTFAPMGPVLVTADAIADPQNLKIQGRVNGHIHQESNTSNMVFSVAQIISIISEGIRLETGDVIATGTPGGVGVFRDPPVFLKPGDTVEVEIEGLEVLHNPIAREA